LKGYQIRTTSSTQISGGNCRDLREDRQVTVTGELEGTRAVRATRIEIKK
jgi:Domain of unknown function (DUF5666)